MVGANYEEIDFKQKDWYYLYEWTSEQEQEFIQWMTNYLLENRAARQELLEFAYKDKKTCNKAAKEFTWNYGWKTMQNVR